MSEIYAPEVHVDISKAFELCSGQKLILKITKGNNSKIMQGRIIILVHCTPP
jgi:hypothetical protein